VKRYVDRGARKSGLAEKRYIVHLDRWTQMPDHNHEREALPFRAAVVESWRSLSIGDNKTDIARLYPAGTRGWLEPGREVVSFRLTSYGPQINRRAHHAEAGR